MRHLLIAIVVIAGCAAEDIHVQLALSDLALPAAAEPRRRQSLDWRAPWAASARVALASGEGFVLDPRGADNDGDRPPSGDRLAGAVIVARIPAGAPVAGRLIVPGINGEAPRIVELVLKPVAGPPETAVLFARARRQRIGELVDRGLPGGAWWRHQLASDPSPDNRRPARELDDTFDLFTGNRALSENLQLDRSLAPGRLGVGDVEVATLTGVTVNEIDWRPLLEGKKVDLDPLAARIPIDQHVVLFPSFAALVAVIDRVDAQGAPVLGAFEERAEDAGTARRYQRQLCLETSELARRFGPALIEAVALTGSDAYLRQGSDVAVLFQARQSDLLRAFLASKHQAAVAAGATATSGTVDGVAWTAVTTPDRTVCSHLAQLGDTVVVTNSLAQLARLAAVAAQREQSLASAPELRFFRDRYRRGDAGESALAVLSDATIRRWCSPRWRIADSRRVRAAAVLSALQAGNVDALATGGTPANLPGVDSAGLGAITWGATGARSAVYGDLAFMTPIAELALERCTAGEADAYRRFVERYQANWRTWFDPIALRLDAGGADLAADLTVMPLIAGSEYRPLMNVVGKAVLAPDAGDPHAGVLAHWALAFDPKSQQLQQGVGMVAMFGLKADPLGWLGGSIAVYADADPFWAELIAAEDPTKFMEHGFRRLPVGVRLAVGNPAKLVLFLPALRAFIEQSSPGMTAWSNPSHRDVAYVRIGLDKAGREFADAALYYLVTPEALLLSFNQALITRAIDRQLDRAAGTATPPAPWLGSALGLRVETAGLAALRGMQRVLGEGLADQMRLRAWANLPILEEWRRRFPDQDPVAVHERLFHVRLVCPAGGAYRWNATLGVMESTLYGSPAAPQDGPDWPPSLRAIAGADFGLGFEHDGLRARVHLRGAAPAPSPAPSSVP